MVSSYDTFCTVWEANCGFDLFRSTIEPEAYEFFQGMLKGGLSFADEPGSNARSLLTMSVRELVDVDRGARPKKSFRSSERSTDSAGSWSFGEWIVYTATGSPRPNHLQQLGTWINEVADIFEANQRNHAPSTSQ